MGMASSWFYIMHFFQRHSNGSPIYLLSFSSGIVASVNGGIWGTVVAFERTGKKDAISSVESEKSEKKSGGKYIVDVLVNTAGNGPLATPSFGGQRLALLPAQAKRLEPQVVSIPLSQVREV